jgi:hypothetical protein
MNERDRSAFMRFEAKLDRLDERLDKIELKLPKEFPCTFNDKRNPIIAISNIKNTVITITGVFTFIGIVLGVILKLKGVL